MNIILPVLILIPLIVVCEWTPGAVRIHGDTVQLCVGWIGLTQFAIAELMAVVAAWRWLRVTGVTPFTLILPAGLVCIVSTFTFGGLAFDVRVSPRELSMRDLGGSFSRPWSAVRSAAVTTTRSEKGHVHYWLSLDATDGASRQVGLSWLDDSQRELLRQALERYRAKR